MFDMPKNTHNDAGYRLCITYNKDANNYVLTGFIVRMNQFNKTMFQMDSAPVVFKTMEDAVNYIVNYGDKK